MSNDVINETVNSETIKINSDDVVTLTNSAKMLEDILVEYKIILENLKADKRYRDEQRKRLSKISERKSKKNLNEICNVCFAPLNLDDIKCYVPCSSCNKFICRGEKCSFWLPKLAAWECQLCNTSINLSQSRTNEWINHHNSNKYLLPMSAQSELFLPIITTTPNERKNSLSNCDVHSQAPSFSSAGGGYHNVDKEQIREYIEEILSEMLGGALDNTPVGQLSNNSKYLPLYENGNNAVDPTEVSHVKLKRLIGKIINETLRIPTLLIDFNDIPPSVSSSKTSVNSVGTIATTTTATAATNTEFFDDGNQSKYFDSKKYQELLATAVLNKIVESHNYEKRSNDNAPINENETKTNLDKNHNQIKTKDQSSTSSSGSSFEPRSDSSFTDPIHDVSKCDNNSPTDSCSNIYTASVNDKFDRESILSDYIAGHKIPLPELSTDSESVNEEYASCPSNEIDDGDDGDGGGTWEDNWLFKKRKLCAADNASSVGMLVPAPREDIKALIGDKTADEISDLSETGSDMDDNDIDLNTNSRIKNKSLIGGKNSINVIDDLVEQTSLISSTSLHANEPIIIETRNEYVLTGNHDLQIETNSVHQLECSDGIPIPKNEAINSAIAAEILKNSPPKKLFNSSNSNSFEETILPPPIDFNDNEILSVFIAPENVSLPEEILNKNNLIKSNNFNTASETTKNINQSDTTTISNNCANNDTSPSQLSPIIRSRRHSAVQFLAAIALGPVLTVCTPEVEEAIIKGITEKDFLIYNPQEYFNANELSEKLQQAVDIENGTEVAEYNETFAQETHSAVQHLQEKNELEINSNSTQENLDETYSNETVEILQQNIEKKELTLKEEIEAAERERKEMLEIVNSSNSTGTPKISATETENVEEIINDAHIEVIPVKPDESIIEKIETTVNTEIECTEIKSKEVAEITEPPKIDLIDTAAATATAISASDIDSKSEPVKNENVDSTINGVTAKADEIVNDAPIEVVPVKTDQPIVEKIETTVNTEIECTEIKSKEVAEIAEPPKIDLIDTATTTAISAPDIDSNSEPVKNENVDSTINAVTENVEEIVNDAPIEVVPVKPDEPIVEKIETTVNTEKECTGIKSKEVAEIAEPPKINLIDTATATAISAPDIQENSEPVKNENVYPIVKLILEKIVETSNDAAIEIVAVTTNERKLETTVKIEIESQKIVTEKMVENVETPKIDLNEAAVAISAYENDTEASASTSSQNIQNSEKKITPLPSGFSERMLRVKQFAEKNFVTCVENLDGQDKDVVNPTSQETDVENKHELIKTENLSFEANNLFQSASDSFDRTSSDSIPTDESTHTVLEANEDLPNNTVTGQLSKTSVINTTHDSNKTISISSTNSTKTSKIDKIKLETLKSSAAFSTPIEIIDGDEDVVVSLDHLVPGSIAEREHKKWYNAVEMPNNPYAPEALRRRLNTGSPAKSFDKPNLSPTLDKAVDNTDDNVVLKSTDVDLESEKTDITRYSRDYYINDVIVEQTKNLQNNTTDDILRKNEILSEEHPLDTQLLSGNISETNKLNTTDKQINVENENCDIFSAKLVQIVDENENIEDKIILDNLNNSTSSTAANNDSLTPSEDSDIVRIYDLNKQETRLITKEDQIQSSVTTNLPVTIKKESPPTPKKPTHRPDSLHFESSTTTICSTTPTRIVTPMSFKFLQPKRKLIEPSQIMSAESNANITPSSPEKQVIEDEVVHVLPSVKALARAFLLTSKCASSQHAKTSLSLETSTVSQQQIEKIEQSTPPPLSPTTLSIEKFPENENFCIAERPLSPVVAVTPGKLKDNIAFFENLKKF